MPTCEQIPGMRDLEPVASPGRAIEEKFVIAQGLTWAIGIDVPVVAANLVWHQAAAGLEMALHADFQLPLPVEARRIDDRLPYFFPRSIRRESRTHMCAPRSMTPLAINPFRNRIGKK